MNRPLNVYAGRAPQGAIYVLLAYFCFISRGQKNTTQSLPAHLIPVTAVGNHVQ